jgi:hypothetical protein
MVGIRRYYILGGIIVALIAIAITELTLEPYRIMVENTIIMTLSGVILGDLIFLFVIIIYALEKKTSMKFHKRNHLS